MLSFTFLEAQKEPRASFFRQPKYAIRFTIKAGCPLIMDKQGWMFYCYSHLFPFMVSWAVLWSADSRDRQASFSLCLLLGGHPALVSHAGRAYVPASSPKTNKRMLLPVCHPGPPAPLASPGTGKNSTCKIHIWPHKYFIKIIPPYFASVRLLLSPMI